MHRLRYKAEAEVRRLLRVLFLRIGAVSADSGPARRRALQQPLFQLIDQEQPGDGQNAKLAGAGSSKAVHNAGAA